MVRVISIITLVALLAVGTAEKTAAQEDTAGQAAAQEDAAARAGQADQGVTGVQTFRMDLAGGEDGAGDGTGNAFIVVSPNSGRVCWGYDVDGIAPPTAAHIHEGASGESGSPVVPLDLGGMCTEEVDSEVIERIADNPSDFYVNIHNDDFPGGALRGQLAN